VPNSRQGDVNDTVERKQFGGEGNRTTIVIKIASTARRTIVG
jgi:hypothetical protein